MNDHGATPDLTSPSNLPEVASLAQPLVVQLEAETFLTDWPTYSRPAEFVCSDGNRYVLKSLRHDADIARSVFNDQVIGRLGRLIGAPVGDVALVRLSPELIALNPQISHMKPGIAHATRRILDAADRVDAIAYAREAGNKLRYAALSILFWWVGASGDRQFIFSNPSHHVHSVDHGHFLPGGPSWTVSSIQHHIPDIMPPPDIAAACGLTPDDYAPSCALLSATTENVISESVTAPPTDWGVSIPEREALAKYLWKRREEILVSPHVGSR